MNTKPHVLLMILSCVGFLIAGIFTDIGLHGMTAAFLVISTIGVFSSLLAYISKDDPHKSSSR